jgi:YesN/AraC family two-component response regulator
MSAKILIVDDEKHILELLAKFMDKHAYTYDLADTVEKAKALIDKGNYDILLTDKNMPDDDSIMEGGMTLLKHAKQMSPETEVIVITGFATIETAIEAMKMGAFEYIMKPIPLVDLKDKIDRALSYKQFINSKVTLQTYRALFNQILNLLLENRDDLPEERIQAMLKNAGARIDHVFGLQKGYEAIVQTQADALTKIEGYAELLIDAIPKESPYFSVIEKIIGEAKKRI